MARWDGMRSRALWQGGTYVSDHDLRNGHRRLMRRLVRGGAVQNNARAATAERVNQGLSAVMESWEGITAKLEAVGA